MYGIKTVAVTKLAASKNGLSFVTLSYPLEALEDMIKLM